MTIHIHLGLRLNESAAIPLFPLYASIPWTGTPLPFYLYTFLFVNIVLPLSPVLISWVAASQAFFMKILSIGLIY